MRTLLLSLLLASQMWAGYSFCVPVTFNNHPASTLSGFPAMFCANGSTGAFCDSVAHTNLALAGFKTAGNGGSVTSSSGYDIRPFTDASCTSAITAFELEPATYVATTGAFVMWINISSLASGADTVIYIGYGNAAVTTDGSSTTTWDSNFKARYHWPNGTSATYADSTSNARAITGTFTAVTAGQIDGAISTTGSPASTYLTLSDTGLPSGAGAVTISTWYAESSGTNSIWWYGTGFNNSMGLRFNGGNAEVIGTNPDVVVTSAQPTGSTPVHFVVRYDGSAVTIWRDGSQIKTDTQAIDTTLSGTFYIATQAWSLNGAGGKWDELSISNVSRSDDWIVAEYNNQKEPWNFYTIGTPVASGGSVRHRVMNQ